MTLALDGDAIDLNSTDLNWGAGTVDWDLDDTVSLSWNYSSGRPELALEVDAVRLREGKARYATCVIASGYAAIGEYGDIGLTELQDDRTCLRLASGRIAVIRVEDFGRDFADLAITVWELP